MNIKFYSVWSFVIIIIYSCDLKYASVSETDIESASTWNMNDQPPSFPQCNNLKNKDHLNCFKSVIEIEINKFLNDKIFPVDTNQYSLILKIDTIGKFTLNEINPSNLLDKTSVNMIKNAVDNIPKAQPAIKTNVGEFVEVTFILPFKLKYE